MTHPADAGLRTTPAEVERSAAAVGPIDEPSRIDALDVLRAFALFGILLVNMYDYLAAPSSALNATTAWLVRFFAEDNFYPIFSMLFGAGFAIQMARPGRSGRIVSVHYLRRLIVLFVIACAFWVLLEDRSILLRYAMLGLPLLLFARSSPRTLLLGAGVCLILAANPAPIQEAIRTARFRGMSAEQVDEQRTRLQQVGQQNRALYARATESGAYMDFVRWRQGTLIPALRGLILGFGTTLPHIFAAFLLGAYAVRRRLLMEPERHLAFLRWVVVVAALIGLAGEVLPLLQGLRPAQAVEDSLPARPLRLLQLTGWLAIAVTYAVVILLMRQKPIWQRQLARIAPAGRMALTNYMLQSVFLTVVFLPMGLGLADRVSASTGAVLTVLFFSTQVVLSHYWLTHFRFGPAEWLWRTLTYGSLPAMRRRHAAPAANQA
jgi:uncharacterized protein